jgi:glycosyltransferase involved in cell wall biosynthesis
MQEGWQAEQGDEYISCSVGIMAHNEEANIGRTIRAVLEQQSSSVRIAEVIVVASGCTDRTVPTVAEIALQEPRVRLCIQEKREGKASTINLFLKQATSPVVVVIGADFLPETLALQYLRPPFKDPTIGMVRGLPVPVNDAATVMGYDEQCASTRAAPHDILDRRYLLSKTLPVTTVLETLDSDDVGIPSTQLLHHLSYRTPISPTRDSWAACDTLSLPVSRLRKRKIPERFFQLVQQRISGFRSAGLGAMLGGIALLYGLVHYCHVEEHIAYFILTIASIEANFWLNRWVNWCDRKGAFLLQWIKCHTTKIGTVLLNQLLFALLIFIGVHYLPATVIGVMVLIIINYVANDQFVFAAPQQQDSLIGSRAQQSTFLPPVGVVVPLRDSQRTIRQCVQSLLAQDYQGAFTIILVGNTPDQDASWEGLGDLVNHPGIHCIQLRRPETWVGRDANVKRYYGSSFALQTGAEIIALTDSQVEVPADWLSTAIRIIDTQQVDGVGGISRRHLNDHTLRGVYQDGSLFSEWPRYGVKSVLSKANLGTAKSPPITANLLFSRNVFERIQDQWPLTCPYGIEDYHLAREMACGGATILCTDTLYVYRLHQRKFRLVKHFSAGIALMAFHQAHPTSGFTKPFLLKACGTVTCLIALIAAAIVLVSMHRIAALPEFGIGLALALLPFSMLSVIKARDWRGIIFPFLDILHIGLMIAGTMYMLVQRGRISPELAKALVKYR